MIYRIWFGDEYVEYESSLDLATLVLSLIEQHGVYIDECFRPYHTITRIEHEDTDCVRDSTWRSSSDASYQ